MPETIGLALSGGGFRACLFHAGALLRLNELGLLPRLSEVSSVSGGSITAAVLGRAWARLEFDEAGVARSFGPEVLEPLRRFCGRTHDVPALLLGLALPWKSPVRRLAEAYDRWLFQGATLQDLPADGRGPRFTIYATSFDTGASVRLSRPYLGDYHLGLVREPRLSLALAVAASSGFPPFFAPLQLSLPCEDWEPMPGADLYGDAWRRERLWLGDGGIYDNLGLERVADRCDVVLVSDAGAPFQPLGGRLGLRLSWLSRTKRVLDIAVEQTRALRKRQLIADFKAGARRGTYWGIATQIGDYGLEARGRRPALLGDQPATARLARTRTRLDAFLPGEQARLIDWGYALADAAVRRHVLAAEPSPGRLPLEWPAD